jgi:hypothetical protein
MNDWIMGLMIRLLHFKAFEEVAKQCLKEANSQLAIRQEKFIRDLNAIPCRKHTDFVKAS